MQSLIYNSFNSYRYFIKLLKSTYIQNFYLSIIIISLILIILLFIIYIIFKNEYIHIESLPIEIKYNNKNIYYSQEFKDISLDKNSKYISKKILSNDYEYNIFIKNDNQILNNIKKNVNLLIYDLSGSVIYVTEPFQEKMHMINNFMLIDQIINDLINVGITSNIDLHKFKKNITHISQKTTIICYSQKNIFNLQFIPFESYINVIYESVINDNKDANIINEFIYKNTSVNIVKFDENMNSVYSNNNIISKNTSLNDSKSLYDKYSDIIHYNVLNISKNTYIVWEMISNHIFKNVKINIKEKLLEIISLVVKISSNIVQKDDKNFNLDNNINKINIIILIIQNYIEELLLLYTTLNLVKLDIYENINNVFINLNLLFNHKLINSSNLIEIKNINIMASYELLEYLIVSCYIISLDNFDDKSIYINIEKNKYFIEIIINNINEKILKYIYKIEYIYKKHCIETSILKINNYYTFKCKFNIL